MVNHAITNGAAAQEKLCCKISTVKSLTFDPGLLCSSSEKGASAPFQGRISRWLSHPCGDRFALLSPPPQS